MTIYQSSITTLLAASSSDMIPNHSQTQSQQTAKRKAPETLNPLLAAAKRLKKEKSGKSNVVHLNNVPPVQPKAPPANDKPISHRRKSSVGSRGKRISGMFEATGIISLPHNSVSESSFYKHIDTDLPDPERIRQLLIWCSSRAATSYASIQSSTSSARSSKPSSTLPPLTPEAAAVLKNVQDDLVRMLAERKGGIRLSPDPKDGMEVDPGGNVPPKKENEQNVKNRQWEAQYTAEIQRAQQEAEKWKQVDYFYESYVKKLSAQTSSPPTLSAKAKGKQRATESDEPSEDELEYWASRENALPEPFRSGLERAKAILKPPSSSQSNPGSKRRGEDRPVGPSATYSAFAQERERQRREEEAEIRRRVSQVLFKIDQLHAYLNTAKKAADVAERLLDQRYALLGRCLKSRSEPTLPPGTGGSGNSGQGHLLTTYVPRSGGEERGGVDSQDILRGLSRLDKERPPAQVGDAARRAVREVQRVEESGAPSIGERRLTGVPVPQTPRKTPGTPRRGNTPRRERDGTPGR